MNTDSKIAIWTIIFILFGKTFFNDLFEKIWFIVCILFIIFLFAFHWFNYREERKEKKERAKG